METEPAFIGDAMMKLDALENMLCYHFENSSLIEEACRHSSYVNEQPDTSLTDNERLEFLGDAVLNLVVGHILMIRNPGLDEGDLSRMRANLVNESRLAKIAKVLDLGAYLKLGKGERQTNGRQKKSILADALEAIIAAVYLDGGFDAAFQFIETHFDSEITVVQAPSANFDYKSKLQEVVQYSMKLSPEYGMLGETGPDHDKTFYVRVRIGGVEAEGTGKNKKNAEQDAARKALEILREDHLETDRNLTQVPIRG